MPTFGRLAASAAWAVLRANGALTSVIFATPTGTTVDYATGQIVTTTAVETLEVKVSPFRPDQVDGIRITVADKKVLVPQAEVTTVPTLQTTVTMAGVPWHVQAPPELTSNDGLWFLHLRRIGDV